jgi:hypothetical protein
MTFKSKGAQHVISINTGGQIKDNRQHDHHDIGIKYNTLFKHRIIRYTFMLLPHITSNINFNFSIAF